MSENRNISPLNTDSTPKGTNDDKLLAYLDGKLTPEEQRELELLLSDEGMESDALDGLETLSSSERTKSISRVNKRLAKRLANKNSKRRRPQTEIVLVAAVLLILTLAIAAYFVLRHSI